MLRCVSAYIRLSTWRSRVRLNFGIWILCGAKEVERWQRLAVGFNAHLDCARANKLEVLGCHILARSAHGARPGPPTGFQVSRCCPPAGLDVGFLSSQEKCSQAARLSQGRGAGESGTQRRGNRERIAVRVRYELETCQSHTIWSKRECH